MNPADLEQRQATIDENLAPLGFPSNRCYCGRHYGKVYELIQHLMSYHPQDELTGKPLVRIIPDGVKCFTTYQLTVSHVWLEDVSFSKWKLCKLLWKALNKLA